MYTIIRLVYAFLFILIGLYSSDIQQLGQLVGLYTLYLEYQKCNRRRIYVRNVNTRRQTLGEYHTLIQELRQMDKEHYFKYFRMPPEIFDHLLNLLKQTLEHVPRHRYPITAAERLAITLRILATGDSQQTVAFSYRLGKSTVNAIFYETLKAIWNNLQPIYLKTPNKQEWLEIANGFWTKWNFPNCLGALDGKHVAIKAPPHSGSRYFNYKRYFSIVFMALVDDNYKFTLVDIGAYGSQSDGGIFSKSQISKVFENNLLEVPQYTNLPGTNIDHPYCIVADEAFPLRNWLMRPFPGRELNDNKRIFNYRLSRARRIVENAFGILSAKFRIFRRCIEATPEHATLICQAAVVLHNYLRSWDKTIDPVKRYCPAHFTDREINGNEVPGAWRSEVSGDVGFSKIKQCGSNMYSNNSRVIRDTLVQYFISRDGLVTWQEDCIKIGIKPETYRKSINKTKHQQTTFLIDDSIVPKKKSRLTLFNDSDEESNF